MNKKLIAGILGIGLISLGFLLLKSEPQEVLGATTLLSSIDGNYLAGGEIIDIGEKAGQIIQCSDVNGVVTDIQLYLDKHTVGAEWPQDATVGIGYDGATTTGTVTFSETGTVDFTADDIDGAETEYVDCSGGTGEFLLYVEPYDDGGVFPTLNRLKAAATNDDTSYGGTSSHCYDAHQSESNFTECQTATTERRDLYFILSNTSASPPAPATVGSSATTTINNGTLKINNGTYQISGGGF